MPVPTKNGATLVALVFVFCLLFVRQGTAQSDFPNNLDLRAAYCLTLDGQVRKTTLRDASEMLQQLPPSPKDERAAIASAISKDTKEAIVKLDTGILRLQRYLLARGAFTITNALDSDLRLGMAIAQARDDYTTMNAELAQPRNPLFNCLLAQCRRGRCGDLTPCLKFESEADRHIRSCAGVGSKLPF